jgi:hypothetical protein
VLGDFPSSLSFLARSNVDFSGIFSPPFVKWDAGVSGAGFPAFPLHGQ